METVVVMLRLMIDEYVMVKIIVLDVQRKGHVTITLMLLLMMDQGYSYMPIVQENVAEMIFHAGIQTQTFLEYGTLL
jgi:hypothetical protein